MLNNNRPKTLNQTNNKKNIDFNSASFHYKIQMKLKKKIPGKKLHFYNVQMINLNLSLVDTTDELQRL
jgi:hypothetical protein